MYDEHCFHQVKKMDVKILKEVIFFLVFFHLFQVSCQLELMVNGTLLPCEKKDKDDFIPPFHIIEDCIRKIRLILNIQNSGKTAEGLQYIYVKEVTEPQTGLKMRLLNPIVLQLRQDQVILAHPFKYLSAVNGKVSEIVVNRENTKNYSGCDDTSSISPTCGIKYDKGNAVPYSEGFCCFCPEKPKKMKQPRGGQDCSVQIGPQTTIQQKYKASAHCLHFSDIWFSVSALGDPIIIHNLYLQVFNQRHLANGSSVWVSLTHGQQFELGHKNPSQYDDNRTIVVTYMTASPKNGSIVLSAETNRLLIPQALPGIGVDKLPPVIKNGATDYLILSKSIIDAKGDECDKAGVSYEGFAKQPNRCGVVKDTCLKNQPLDFWSGDNEKRKSGQKGRYILQNYATPYKDPIIVDLDTKEHWLALEYHEKHLSVLTVEFNADDIIALSVGLDAQITSVITGSFERRIEFFISVTNNGLVEARLSVKVVECEFKVPDSNNVTQVIPPQLMKTYTLTSTPGIIELIEKFMCTVVVTSKLHGIVAKRDVIIKPRSRCICNWHCRCSCLGESLICQPLSEDNYHLAGFRGSLPILTAKSPPRPWIMAHPFFTLLIIVLVLLILGGIKASFGLLGCEKVGYFGLQNRIYRPEPLKRYTERELRSYNVVYDHEGYPVHPERSYPTKALAYEIICLLNIIFFFIWPFIKLSDFCAKRKRERKIEEINSPIPSENESSSDEELNLSHSDKIFDRVRQHIKRVKEFGLKLKKTAAFASISIKISVLSPYIVHSSTSGLHPIQTEPSETLKKKVSEKVISKVLTKAKERAGSVHNSSGSVQGIRERSKSKIPRARPTSPERQKEKSSLKNRHSSWQPVRQSFSESVLSEVSSDSLVPPSITEQWQKGGHIAAAVTGK